MNPDKVRRRGCSFAVCTELDGLRSEVMVSSDGAKSAISLSRRSASSVRFHVPVLDRLTHRFDALEI